MSAFLGLNEDHERLRELVQEFVRRVVVPVAAELDRRPDPADCFSWEIVEQLSEIGLRTLTLSDEYGGAGVDPLTASIVIEELGKGDLGVAAVLAQTLSIAQTIEATCTNEQKARYLPRFRDDPRFLLAICVSDLNTSAGKIVLSGSAGAPQRTVARRREGGWILNGIEPFVLNGNYADLYLVFAETEDRESPAPIQGSTCLLVDRNTPGLSTGRVSDKVGMRLANDAEIVFRDCLLPDENIVGEVGQGAEVQRVFSRASNVYAAAGALGLAESAYERALAWTRQRVQGGRVLIEHETIGSKLAELRMLVEGARAYVYQAAWATDHGEQSLDSVPASLSRVSAAEVAWRVSSSALDLHGGHGYMNELGLEKLVRDAATCRNSGGANRGLLLLRAAESIRQDDR